MFGSALVSLQQFMEDRLGRDKWKSLLINAGIEPDKVYRSLRFYPDSEFDRLVKEGTPMLGMKHDELVRQLGRAFGDYLLNTYSIMFFRSWRTLDVIEKAAPKVFKSIQLIDPYTPKSSVKTERISADEVVVHYESPRQLCVYLSGIIDAMGDYYGESIEITEVKCMHHRALECEIHVKLLAPKDAIDPSKN